MVKGYVVGPLQSNAYLLSDTATRRALLIDPGEADRAILQDIQNQHLRLEWIINTHGHFDHVCGNAFFKQQTQAEIMIHRDDVALLERAVEQAILWGLAVEKSPPPDTLLEEQERLELIGHQVVLIHTPGHSPGGVCFYFPEEGCLFAGDTLFAGSIGRTDFPGGSYEVLLDAIKTKLFKLPDDTLVYPGHGPQTTIGQEKRYNPFLMT